MAKVHITFSDEDEQQAVGIRVTFDPELSEDSEPTPSQIMGVEFLKHVKHHPHLISKTEESDAGNNPE